MYVSKLSSQHQDIIINNYLQRDDLIKSGATDILACSLQDAMTVAEEQRAFISTTTAGSCLRPLTIQVSEISSRISGTDKPELHNGIFWQVQLSKFLFFIFSNYRELSRYYIQYRPYIVKKKKKNQICNYASRLKQYGLRWFYCSIRIP
jgi:hypothetical protein